MNLYIVYIDGSNDKYIVKANTKKEAEDFIYKTIYKDKNVEDKKNGYAPTFRKEINAINLNKDKELNDYGYFEI